MHLNDATLFVMSEPNPQQIFRKGAYL